MRYPKYNGKQFDELRRKEFDYWREQFADILNIDNKTMKLNLGKEQIETEAWNLAFILVTKEIK